MKSSKISSKKFVAGVVLVVIAVLLLALFSTSSGIIDVPDSVEKKTKISCTATVGGLLIGDAELQGVSCFDTGSSCYGVFSIGSNPLSIFAAEGSVIFDAGDQRVQKQFSFTRGFGSESVKATLCSTSNNVAVSLVNKVGEVIGSSNTAVN